LSVSGRQIVTTDEGADKCLSMLERPRTPEHIRKYRKSYFSEAGQRVVHPGLIEGPPRTHNYFPPQSFIFKSEGGTTP
jgi:hypothetical protein